MKFVAVACLCLDGRSVIAQCLDNTTLGYHIDIKIPSCHFITSVTDNIFCT